MLDNDDPTTTSLEGEAASDQAPAADQAEPEATGDAPAEKPAPRKKAAAKRKAPAKKKAEAAEAAEPGKPDKPDKGERPDEAERAGKPDTPEESAKDESAAPKKKAAAKKKAPSKKKAEAAPDEASDQAGADETPAADETPEGEPARKKKPSGKGAKKSAATAAPLFQAPDPSQATTATAAEPVAGKPSDPTGSDPTGSDADAGDSDSDASDSGLSDSGASDGDGSDSDDSDGEGSEGGPGGTRRRRRRGGRRRRRGGGNGSGGQDDSDDNSDDASDDDSDEDQGGDSGDSGKSSGKSSGKESGKQQDKADQDTSDGDSDDGSGDDGSGDGGSGDGGSSSRRRRRRRRSGGGDNGSGDDPENTATRTRKPRAPEDEITALSGSTRLEAKKQRRREGREAGRRRAPIVSEAEFLARRESVDRSMVVRQRDDLTQIAVLEDKVLVEHYVSRASQTSLIGNIYLGRVQNVLPSMEAAFIDIGKGRNAVLYAGEVNWSALGHQEGQPRKIESVLSSGQSVLVQVTKDPVGNKGARLTSQISLAGRFLVYVPDGTNSGISRKLPDTERSRLKALLKEIVPDTAGVIVRTAAEGASEEELTRDVERLRSRWESIEGKRKGGGPKLLYGEPDLTVKVVRDLFTEDFDELVVEGDDAWSTVHDYVSEVAPDLEERVRKYERETDGPDVFAAYRIDEQIAKGLDRKVWLPSGGSLIIDRTEAMTVVDVNTGKFTGSGGNLEETVTRNNLEAAEEIVRQLRLRDIGGIIVVDFIDMVLESNRDLVLRRLVECLGRDRTRHQVAEVTSLGLVQMTRKRIGTGLLEAFSEPCEHCDGRGLHTHEMPVEPGRGGSGGGGSNGSGDGGRKGRRRGGRGRSGDDSDQSGSADGKSGQPKSGQPKSGQGRSKQDSGQDGSGDDASRRRPTPAEFAAMAHSESSGEEASEEAPDAGPVEKPEEAGQSQEPGQSEQAEKPEQAEQSEQSEQPGQAEQPEQAEQPDRSDEGTAQQPADAEPAAERTAEPADEAGAPEGPRVVSRTRRRASRPTGISAAPVSITLPAAPADGGAEPDPAATAEEQGSAPEPPRVVTRTRTRGGASRPQASSGGEHDD